MRNTVVISNINHYAHLAAALDKSEYLRSFLTYASFHSEGRLLRLLPPSLQAVASLRKYSGIDPNRVHQIFVPEVLQRLLPALRLSSRDAADWVNDHLFGHLAANYAPAHCEVLHTVGSVGLEYARRVKPRGTVVVCHVRQLHPVVQENLTRAAQRANPRTLTPSPATKRLLQCIEIADHVCVPSELAKRSFVASGVNSARVNVCRYGVSLPSESCRRRPDRFTVMYAGTVSEDKGVDTLIAALSSLPPTRTVLAVAGRVEREFEATLLATPCELENHGPLRRHTLMNLYRRASVFVLPSRSDSWGLVGAEAMACGTPLIVTEQSGVSEIVTNGVEGFVFPAGDVTRLSQLLQFLYEHPEACQEMGRAAHRRACLTTWEDYEQRIIQLQRRICTKD